MRPGIYRYRVGPVVYCAGYRELERIAWVARQHRDYLAGHWLRRVQLEADSVTIERSDGRQWLEIPREEWPEIR